ncbi:FhaA domain-containing protein [Neomicrococcus lactis]|uniref:PSer/pThr/pTyr-binding forkhead associated (FHA) protein n=1 Tax=Neomicrococcus lactis TaxID=732241 RepID=A0A7W9DCF4_9MICC|nr:DUF3662 and FHA domain-containing protein [Neomicrococcus lactis]MBB5598837.1 pSer/pThr/pTyr-binding forkhead associated (FHA) protein [Neomicrococcus lactis]
MGLVDNVERGLEKLVTSVFRGSTQGGIKPVEIASRLRNEMDARSFALSQGRTLAPNNFDIFLSPEDFASAKEWGPTLAEELCDVALDHAHSQSYTLQGSVRVSFKKRRDTRPGHILIQASISKDGEAEVPAPRRNDPPAPTYAPPAPRQNRPQSQPQAASPGPSPQPVRPQQVHPQTVAAPPVSATRAPEPPRTQPVIEVNGKRFAINANAITIGRSKEADITVDDARVSRKHIEIFRDTNGIFVEDLGSTNGTSVNGYKIDGPEELLDGTHIMIGSTRINFRLMPDTRRASGGGR